MTMYNWPGALIHQDSLYYTQMFMLDAHVGQMYVACTSYVVDK